MYSKLLLVFVLWLAFIRKSFVCGNPVIGGYQICLGPDAKNFSDLYHTVFFDLRDRSSNHSICPWDLASRNVYKLHENRDCEWKTLSDLQSPASLIVKVFKNSPVQCSWIIEAPEGKHVYVYGFDYAVVSPSSRVDTMNPYSNALNVGIYDGDRVDESKRLFKAGDEHLENVKSTGRKITISLDFNGSDNYKSQSVAAFFTYV
ncbi:uncharacterized protein LOC107980835 [Nasonia vitripennis]|uniref:CUB domain-containing protein n=1 Tax=Nasonia vitripennis TaxID=7425 RepID=A0A7M7IP90_NASVI|nr:uncharacterized protein LOC107980835 [Nasonia vitripennis]